jgi:hypothetical protein
VTLTELQEWHLKKAEEWRLVVLREPESFPRSPAVQAEYERNVKMHEEAVELVGGVLGEGV